jgi:hypothetical protein
MDRLSYNARNELAHEIAKEVWRGLSGNGSLHINIDTDVECYGPWEPHGKAPYDTPEGKVQEAQSWLEYFVFNTLRRLDDRGRLS